MEELLKEFSLKMQTQEFSYLFLLVSFFGGVLASLSPCSLGMLPIIVGYVASCDEDEKSKCAGADSKIGKHFRTFIQLTSFVFGLAVVLTVIGVICAVTGKVFMSFGGPYFILILASLILLFGLSIMGALEIPLPTIVKQMPKSNGPSLFVYPFIVGTLFALAATPCSTPILAGIMSFATLSQNLGLAALMLFLFSLGQGLVIVLVGVSTSMLKGMKQFATATDIIMKIAGVLLILSAFFLYYKVFSKFFM